MRRVAAIAALTLAACGSSTVPPPQEAAHRHELERANRNRLTPDPDPTAGIEFALAAAERQRPARAARSKIVRPRQAPPARTRPAGGDGCTLDVIRQRESGNNYSATSPSGKYRGAYQFDASTWRSVGGTGDPAAASPEEQDARAAELMRRRGTQPWSVCR